MSLWKSLGTACLWGSDIHFRNVVLIHSSFCFCKGEDKTLILRGASKANDTLETLVKKWKALLDKDDFGFQMSFLLVIGIH